MKPYYKKSDGKVVELKQQDELWLCGKFICYNNKLTELIVPAGCKKVYCYNNQLKELIIPDNCKCISCESNQLKELIIPDGCECVEADMKSITILNKVDRLYLCI